MKKIKNNNTKKFPKYVSPIINMANRFSRATSPANVGKMSELFKEFKSSNNTSLNSWKRWYIEKNPDAIESAVKKISSNINELKKAIDSIDEDMIRTWVEDLVFDKTFNGLTIQEQILFDIASETNTTYRMADEKEESRGIDGYVGDTAYSIKPDTYKTMNHIIEEINVKMIFYKKSGDSIQYEIIN